jgi:hypothetical protein
MSTAPTTQRRRTFKTVGAYATETAEPKQIVVELEGDTLAFRHPGSRVRYRLEIATAMREAIIRHAETLPDPEKK